jgi:cation:H+ antiporter
MPYLLLLFGIIFLIKGSDYLVDGASALALKLKVSTLIIGLTVVSFGTSMPELLVNVISSLKNYSGVAFGNIIGSNMANILLILGVTSLITELKIKHSTTWREIPFSFLASVVLFVFCSTSFLDNIQVDALLRTEGIILILFFLIFLYYVFELSKHKKVVETVEDKEGLNYSNLKIFIMLLIGVLGLYLGGQLTVDNAVIIAKQIGFSEFFVSATIVAFGTSLPELITSIKAARRNDVDLAVGNVVGSNIFNIFWILGISSIIKPIPFTSYLTIDLLLLMLATFLLFLFTSIGKKHCLQKWQGIIFIISYFAYIAFLLIRK